MITTQKIIFFLTTSYLLILSLIHCADAKECSPSACGDIRNISYPFRLNSDHTHCGRSEFKLTCENNITFINLYSIKYYVKAINYQNETIRLADASINNNTICSFPVTFSYHEFTVSSKSYYFPSEDLSVYLISCPIPLNNSSLFTDFTACNLSHPRFSYVHVGLIMPSQIPRMCRIDLILATSWPAFMDLKKNVSPSEIHQSLLYGFELRFCSDCRERFTTTAWGKCYRLNVPLQLSEQLDGFSYLVYNTHKSFHCI